MVCDRIGIMNAGRLLALGTLRAELAALVEPEEVLLAQHPAAENRRGIRSAARWRAVQNRETEPGRAPGVPRARSPGAVVPPTDSKEPGRRMMQTIFQTWALARKDLRLFLGDRRGVLLCFAVPIVLATAFGMLFDRPGGTAGFRPRVLVVAGDSEPLTRKIIAGLCACDKLEATESGRGLCPQGVGRSQRRRGHRDAARLSARHNPGPAGRLDAAAGASAASTGGFAGSAYWTEGIFTEVAMRETVTEALAPCRKRALLHRQRGPSTSALQPPWLVPGPVRFRPTATASAA